MNGYDYCPTLGLSCSTAALTYGCRCEVCARWHATHLEQRREGRPAKIVHARSPQCPQHACAASTAYRVHKCRCAVCRGWNAGREHRRKGYAKADASWEKMRSELESDPMAFIDFAAWVARNVG